MPTQSGNQTQTSVTKLPAWYDAGAQQALQQAQAAAAAIAHPYMGNTVAGLTPMQQNAINLTGQNIGSTNGAYALANANTQRAMNYRPSNVYGGTFLQGNISRYMNPYIQNVEKSALSNMDRAYQQNVNSIGDQAITSGAFGGSRHGVAEGVAAAENARQMGDMSAQLRSDGYNQAANMMGSDLNRAFQARMANQSAGLTAAQMRMQGANQLGSLASQKQNAYLQSLQAALQAGQISQQQAQAYLNQQQNQYNAMSDIPANQLNLLLSALNGMQVPTSTKTKVPTSGNWLTGMAGGALAGMPMGPWGMIGGGLLGGAASIY